MINSMNELYEKLKGNNITKDVLDVFKEFDVTNSSTTQASLNNLLLDLYKRLSKEDITIEGIGERVTEDEFRRWVNENLDQYSRDMFFESIEAKED